VKPTLKLFTALLIAPLAALQAADGPCDIQPANFLCEYLANPQGIHVPQPRLSWVLQARDPAARGLHQSAYQILVAASPASLAQDKHSRTGSGFGVWGLGFGVWGANIAGALLAV